MKRINTAPINCNAVSKVCLVERAEYPGEVKLVNANRVAKRNANDLVQLASELQKADTFIKSTACNKLQVIVEQVRHLQNQAKHILEEAAHNAELHRVACNFVKVPGNIYHLYERPSGQKYFSMLSPEEWSSPHIFHGSYRLEADQGWTDVQKISERDRDVRQITSIFNSGNPLSLSDVPMEFEN